eukprot:3940947-Rhodomonas_salina.6
MPRRRQNLLEACEHTMSAPDNAWQFPREMGIRNLSSEPGSGVCPWRSRGEEAEAEVLGPWWNHARGQDRKSCAEVQWN